MSKPRRFLREQGVTLASIDGPPADGKHFTIMPAVDEVTDGRLAYLRLHGRDAQAYLTGKTVAERFHYDYSDGELDEVLGRAQDLSRQADVCARRLQQQQPRFRARGRRKAAPQTRAGGEPAPPAHAPKTRHALLRAFSKNPKTL